MARCPVCDQADLVETGKTVDLTTVLHRWEAVTGKPFPPAVWQHYAEVAPRPLRLACCAHCRFGAFLPPAAGTAEFYAAIEETNYFVPDKWEFEQAAQDLAALGARRVLDVGCGSGHFLRHLQQRCPAIGGVAHDLNRTLLQRLQAEGFETLPGAPDEIAAAAGRIVPFDAICMFQVLEHAADPMTFLRAFLPLLRPEGRLILTTPNAAGPIRHFADALTELPPHHVTRWTGTAFATGLARLGFDVAILRDEPLPDYLWDAYLPVLWGERIWPAQLFDPIAMRQGLQSTAERASFAAAALRSVGIKRLYGVPSHTIYVLAERKEPE